MGFTNVRSTLVRPLCQLKPWLAGTMTLVLGLALVFAVSVPMQAETTLVFAHHFPPEQMRALKELVFDPYTEMTGVKFEFVQTSQGAELVEQVTVLTLGGSAPDIIRLGTDYTPLAAAGMLEDLTPWIMADGVDVDRLIPVAYESFHWGGKQVGLPTTTSSFSLFINGELYEMSGLPMPSTDWHSSGWTWDEFLNAARRFTIDRNGDGTPEQYGVSWLGDFWMWGWSDGADWVTPDRTRISLDDPNLIAGMERYVDIHTVENVVGGHIFQETAVMHVNGNWGLAAAANAKIPLVLAPLPRGEGDPGRHPILMPNGVMISSSSKNKEAAWEFIKWITLDSEGARRKMLAVDRLPSLPDLYPDLLEKHSEVFPQARNEVWLGALEVAKPIELRRSAAFATINSLLEQAVSQARRGEKPITTSFSQIINQVNVLLEQNPIH